MPDWPCLRKSRRAASQGLVEIDAAGFRPCHKTSGKVFPTKRANRLRIPGITRGRLRHDEKAETLFARGVSCGDFGAN